MTTPPTSDSSYKLLSRSDLLILLRTGISVGSLRFTRQLALTWLAHYPGDLPVNLLYARSLHQAGRDRQALISLEKICQADPEDLEAWEMVARTTEGSRALDPAEPSFALQLTDSYAAIQALGGCHNNNVPLPIWAQGLRQVRQSLLDSDIDTAEQLIHQALLLEKIPALIAVTHLKVAVAQELPSRTLHDLADYYHQLFPECILPILILADALINSCQSTRGVALLHQAATQDVIGQVAIRLWGTHHPYRDLWPDHMEAPIEIAIPADISATLGWNRLPSMGETIRFEASPLEDTQRINPKTLVLGATARSKLRQEETQPTTPLITPPPAVHATNPNSPAGPTHVLPESLRSVQAELERVATSLKRDILVRSDGRFPVYVLLTTRSGLEKQYGVEGFSVIDQELNRLTGIIAARRDWGAVLLYVDDLDCMSTLSLCPAQPDDPWSIKLALADLDATLARQGEMIGALLIVGGPEVIPFHHLPNPVDDDDIEVPSDNPYGTRDENYFIPEWPVGRLPGGTRPDEKVLIKLLGQISERHAHLPRSRPWSRRWWDSVRTRLGRGRQHHPSWGYTAAIWRRASLSVFRPIGDPHAMLVSPPAQIIPGPQKSNREKLLPPSRLGYFNLHGLQDASEWYGQRDPTDPTEQPDYPVALRPQDVVNGGRAPQVVFTEACFGANVLKKDIEEALALKFLASGSQAVVGSTCTAYGSITTPLIGADLLGHSFWKYLREGLPAGEAIRRAKIHLAREMHRRQGYLDGEDQKTLIAFVLYGDPLAYATDVLPRAKQVLRPLAPPAMVKTVCDRLPMGTRSETAVPHSFQDPPPLPVDTLAQVKQVVQQYLPGMLDARLTYTQTHATCSGDGHHCPTAHLGAKARPVRPLDRSVITLSKQVGESSPLTTTLHIHHHFARLTLDGRGKLVKLSVSR